MKNQAGPKALAPSGRSNGVRRRADAPCRFEEEEGHHGRPQTQSHGVSKRAFCGESRRGDAGTPPCSSSDRPGQQMSEGIPMSARPSVLSAEDAGVLPGSPEVCFRGGDDEGRGAVPVVGQSHVAVMCCKPCCQLPSAYDGPIRTWLACSCHPTRRREQVPTTGTCGPIDGARDDVGPRSHGRDSSLAWYQRLRHGRKGCEVDLARRHDDGAHNLGIANSRLA